MDTLSIYRQLDESKKEAAEKIKQAIYEFEEKTGLKVTAVEFNSFSIGRTIKFSTNADNGIVY